MDQMSPVDTSWRRNFAVFVLAVCLFSVGMAINYSFMFIDSTLKPNYRIIGWVTLVSTISGCVVACFVADVWYHHRMLIAVALIGCVSAALLAVMGGMTFAHDVNWVVYAMIAVQSVARALAIPIMTAMIPHLVPASRVTQAIGASIVAMGLGGLIEHLTRYTAMELSVYRFWIMALLLLGTGITLYFVRVPVQLSMIRQSFQLRYLLQGFGFVRHNPLVRTLIVVNVFVVLIHQLFMSWLTTLKFNSYVSSVVKPILFIQILAALLVGIGLLSRPIMKLGRTLLVSMLVAGLSVAMFIFFVWHESVLLFIVLRAGATTLFAGMVSALCLLLVPGAVRGRVIAISMILSTVPVENLVRNVHYRNVYIVEGWMYMGVWLFIVLGVACMVLSVRLMKRMPTLFHVHASQNGNDETFLTLKNDAQ